MKLKEVYGRTGRGGLSQAGAAQLLTYMGAQTKSGDPKLVRCIITAEGFHQQNQIGGERDSEIQLNDFHAM